MDHPRFSVARDRPQASPTSRNADAVYAFRTINAKQSRKTRWSATAFVLVAALLFSVIAFRHVTSALILVAVVLAIVIAVHAALRVARRRG